MSALRIILMVLAFISLPVHAKDDRNLAVNAVKNAVSEQRIALVIGNGAYANSPLKNPVNDANDVATKLRELGFDVIERTNLHTKQIGSTLREFRSKLMPGAVALVFYAGHGLQIKGDNYLPAVDADINSEEDVQNQSLAVKQIMDVLEDAKTRLNLVFLDACRNNPYARNFRSAERGLARVSAPSGTLISYATRPGSVAADGDGRNGLYTSKLLAQMSSNLQIEQALKRVVTAVKAASQGRQEPWMEGSIEGDFCFSGCEASSTAHVTNLEPQPARIKGRDEIEQETWESARDSGSISAIQEYLKYYPKGLFAGQARVQIAALKQELSQSAESRVSPAREDGDAALWNAVEKGNNSDDYDAYLSQYPNGKYAALARSRIKKLQDEVTVEAARREQELWLAAEQAGNEVKYQAYLNSYPQGNYAGLAQARIQKIQTDQAEKSNRVLELAGEWVAGKTSYVISISNLDFNAKGVEQIDSSTGGITVISDGGLLVGKVNRNPGGTAEVVFKGRIEGMSIKGTRYRGPFKESVSDCTIPGDQSDFSGVVSEDRNFITLDFKMSLFQANRDAGLFFGLDSCTSVTKIGELPVTLVFKRKGGALGQTNPVSESLKGVGLLGISLSKTDPQLIAAVSPGMPAAEAGIKVGDRIQRVDGKDVGGLTVVQLVEMVRGEVGSKVTIQIVRQGETSPLTFTLVRKAL